MKFEGFPLYTLVGAEPQLLSQLNYSIIMPGFFGPTKVEFEIKALVSLPGKHAACIQPTSQYYLVWSH